ncbi:MAG: hypothetical protein AAGF11_53500 [Myxococcota bacterium]
MRTVFFASLLAMSALGPGCGMQTPTNPPVSAINRGGVTFVRARCASASSCLLGQVVAAETATPLSRATVFLEREDGDGDGDDDGGGGETKGPQPVKITTLTDDQGVFAVEEPPAGRYRLQVFKRERRLEVRGLALGQPGTTMVPVRLPQG